MSKPRSFVIRQTWPRPDPSLIQFFRGIPTALVADALAGFGVVDPGIRPVWKGPSFVGPALPVEVGPQDNLATHVALKFSQPGDVMMVATGRSLRAGIIGGVTTGLFRNAGLAGAVTDGAARDVEEIEANGIPVYAGGLSPGMPFKDGPGRIGLPISVGDVAVEAGDIVLGDNDGVVVVPQRQARQTRDAISEARAYDEILEAAVTSRTKVPPWAEEALTKDGVIYLTD